MHKQQNFAPANLCSNMCCVVKLQKHTETEDKKTHWAKKQEEKKENLKCSREPLCGRTLRWSDWCGIISAIWFGRAITEAAYSQLTRLMDPRAAGDRGLAVTLRWAPPYASYYANWEFKGLLICRGPRCAVMDEVISSRDYFESSISPL